MAACLKMYEMKIISGTEKQKPTHREKKEQQTIYTKRGGKILCHCLLLTHIGTAALSFR